jgi:tRNA threonylcarbamoyladenosine modification (KEOPS) complex Cgi121 subunit
MESFLERFGKENGETVYIAISVKDYENLSLNMAEIKRFLEQQNNIIVYYEDSINKTNTEEAGQ